MLKKINEELDFRVDITEDEPSINVADEIAITEFRLQNNMVSIIDLMAKQNPDITNEDEIAEILKKNKEINQKYLNHEQDENNQNGNDKDKASAEKSGASGDNS